MKPPPNQTPNFNPFFKPQNDAKQIIKVILGVIILISGLFSILLFNSAISGLMRVIAGLLLIPATLKAIERVFHVTTNRVVRYVAIALLIFVSFIISVRSIVRNVDDKNTTAGQNNFANKPNYQYQILRQESNGSDDNSFQNIFVFIKTADKSENAVKQIASQLKDKLCSGRCNLSLYDDTTSYKLENKLADEEKYLADQLSNGRISKKQYLAKDAGYQRQYLVPLADHLIGTIDIDSDDLNYYPLRDSTYKALGGKY